MARTIDYTFMHCIVATSCLAEQVDEIAQTGLPVRAREDASGTREATATT
jgi:hypothetical protein